MPEGVVGLLGTIEHLVDQTQAPPGLEELGIGGRGGSGGPEGGLDDSVTAAFLDLDTLDARE